MSRRLFLLSLILTTLVLLSARQSPPAGAHSTKISPHLQTALARDGTTEFLVVLADQAAPTTLPLPREKAARGAALFQTLQARAAATQGPILTLLAAAGAPRRGFWIANAVWTRGDADLAARLAARQDVAALVANPWVQVVEPAGSAPNLFTVESSLAQIGADAAWAGGFTGAGIVLGGQDTGYQWDHPALINQYRGWNGSGVDHNYQWHDAIHEENPSSPSPNLCGLDLSAPCDDNSHGTHTMGTMLGNDLDPTAADWPAGATNAVGVAPGAKWIACRNMESGYGSPASYIECFQWFVAPTDLNDENPNPALAPHAINNSWYCPPSEGCDAAATGLMETVVDNVRAAGIVVVTSAGNSGPSCDTVTGPPAIFDSALAVGAVDGSDNIASFSSRGPSSWSGLTTPMVVAPGVSIRSTVPGDGYGFKSGTSMAAPHVTGLIALLLEARPDLIGQVDQIETFLRLGATPLTGTQSCGGVAGTTIPNNTYGWGRVDAMATLTPELTPTAFLPAILTQP